MLVHMYEIVYTRIPILQRFVLSDVVSEVTRLRNILALVYLDLAHVH